MDPASCLLRDNIIKGEREVARRQQMEVIGRIRLLNRWQVGFYTVYRNQYVYVVFVEGR